MVSLRRSSQMAINGFRSASHFRRALMYVPASDERKLSHIGTMKADCIVMDCEDGVAYSGKDSARQNVAKLLQRHREKRLCTTELGWRLNSVGSGLIEPDMQMISELHAWPDAIMLPKVDSVGDLKAFHGLMSNYMGNVERSMRLVIWIESARALHDMNKILTAAANMCRHSPLILDGVVFGSDDYCADTGITATADATELNYARQRFLSIANLHNLQAIDIVFTDIKNLEALRRQCVEGSRFGFTGKQVIHPSHLPIVHELFTPSERDFLRAKELLDYCEQKQLSGVGAVDFNGRMVDRPIILQAKRIVSMFQQYNG